MADDQRTGQGDTAPQVVREIEWRNGALFIRSTCRAGHSRLNPNKGLGRANAGAWESRHATCEPTP